LRNLAGNFTREELQQAIRWAHRAGVRVYVACNIYPRNFELSGIREFLQLLKHIEPDGVILSDPGIIDMAIQAIPEIDIHLSTQANTTNLAAARFWERLGVRRINVARELSLEEIGEISGNGGMEIEAFVHGAMCISYSGRCLLSGFMANRESNRGECCQPCRWRYRLVEEKRPGQYIPVHEDQRGTYIFSSRDLCMIGHIPEMIRSGVKALKIEGRMKSIHYLATTVNAYRKAIDAYLEHPENYEALPSWVEELESVTARGYCTGFYLGPPDTATTVRADAGSTRPTVFVAKILEDIEGHWVRVDVRNRFLEGEEIEIISPGTSPRTSEIRSIRESGGQATTSANPGNIVDICLFGGGKPMDLIRRRST
jgi:putative protease